jgi:simple sugar transport system ATP-binding protein
MVFQHFMLADNLTVLENVVLGAEKLHGIGARPAPRSRGSPTLRLDSTPTGCRGPRRRRPAAGGDPQGALPRRPIVILDEPTAVLVPQEVDELFGNLRELKAEGLTLSSSRTSSTRCSPSPTRSP